MLGKHVVVEALECDGFRNRSRCASTMGDAAIDAPVLFANCVSTTAHTRMITVSLTLSGHMSHTHTHTGTHSWRRLMIARPSPTDLQLSAAAARPNFFLIHQ